MIRTLLSVLVAALVVVTGARGAAAQPRNLVVQVSTEPPGLDLVASPASAIAAVVHYNIQECLVTVHRTGKLVPWLAERWPFEAIDWRERAGDAVSPA